MNIIYIVMETIDLGGSTVQAFYDQNKADVMAEALNTAATSKFIESLVATGRYTQEQAMAQAPYRSFYVEEVALS